MTKKNTLKALSKNKGFTLVELIVVLVILAILAAILVPTLLGYIDKARSEKDFATAQSVRVAVQAQIDELYGKNGSHVKISDFGNDAKAAALKLVGVDNDSKIDGQKVEIKEVEIDSSSHLTGIIVAIGNDTAVKYYKYTSSKNTWEATTSSDTLSSSGSSATPGTNP